MKKNKVNLLFFVIMSITVFMSSCSKEGVQGPIGPEGEQGIQGIQGVAGKDGGVFYSGTGVPATSLGKKGDIYLDKTGSNLYGPKSDTGWGTPLNLKGTVGATGSTGAKGDKGDTGSIGATGATGIPGSKILSGATNPTAAVGVVSDYYLNKTTGDLFGPKTIYGWGTAINLKGTANVVATTWITYNWNSTNTATQKVMDYTIPAPILAAVGYSSLFNFSARGGVILIYGQNWGSNGIRMFNYEYRNGRYIAEANEVGNKIWVSLGSINGSALRDIEYDSARGNRFRYVLIAAGVQLSGASATTRSTSEIDWSKISYEEVKELLQLED